MYLCNFEGFPLNHFFEVICQLWQLSLSCYTIPGKPASKKFTVPAVTPWNVAWLHSFIHSFIHTNIHSLVNKKKFPIRHLIWVCPERIPDFRWDYVQKNRRVRKKWISARNRPRPVQALRQPKVCFVSLSNWFNRSQRHKANPFTGISAHKFTTKVV